MKVGIIGAGTMGQGIAKAFAQVDGYEVALCDIKQEWAEGGKDKIAKGYARLVQKGKMTQEQVAGRLGVSKWESKRSCPDIGLLPQIARMFDTTIDGLFGIQTESVQPQVESLAPIGIVENLPWPDDGALHAVVY